MRPQANHVIDHISTTHTGLLAVTVRYDYPSRLLKYFCFCLICVVSSRLILLLIGFVSQAQATIPPDLVNLWYQWDANWYHSIVTDGYHLSDTYVGPNAGFTNVNFFPLFPGLVWLTSFLVPTKIAGLVVANISFLFGCATLYHLTKERFGEDVARGSILSICFFPGSFVFSTNMTEALFFLLSTLGFYYAWHQKLFAASIAGGLLSVTRPNGIFFAVALIVGWLTHRLFPGDHSSSYKNLFIILLIPIPLCLFMLFLLWNFNDAFAFVNSHLHFWSDLDHWPLLYLADVAQAADIRRAVASGLALFMMLAFLLQARRFTVAEVAMVIICILSITSAISSVRFLLPLFQIHTGIGFLVAKKPWGLLIVAVLAALNGLFMALWVRGDAIFV